MNADLLRSASQARVLARAERGAGSLPFIVLGATTATLGALLLFGVFATDLALAPTPAFIVLLVVVSIRARRRGIGLGSDGYVFLAIAGGLLLLAAPILVLCGAATFLGLGLLLLGVRGGDTEMGAGGMALAIVGWLTMRPLPAFGGDTNGIVLAVSGVALVAFGLMRTRSERQITRAP